MANKLDEINVVDIESTCWDRKTPDRLQEGEIIEIGVCVINLSQLTITASESILVLPENSTISEFRTRLTTITQDLLDKSGISFQEACLLLRDKYNANNRAWASWGDYDRRQFERQCKRCWTSPGSWHPYRYPFGPTHLNVKNLFAITMGLTREVGMEEALKQLDIELEGTHHRGMDDARNIAKIACRLLKQSREKVGQDFTPRV